MHVAVLRMAATASSVRQAIATGQAQRQANLATYETRREVQATQDAQARQQRQAHHQREVLYAAKYLFRNVQLLDREESLDNLQASIEWLSAGVSVITGLGEKSDAVKRLRVLVGSEEQRAWRGQIAIAGASPAL